MRPVIALLTDFGTKDHFVAAVKGTILSIARDAAIVDITHDIGRHDVRSAAFVLSSCFVDFPPSTIFVAVVDPGVGSSTRRAIAAKAADRFFVGPDNGIFSLLFNGDSEVYELHESRFFRESVSSTFHGRDVFAPVAAHIANGEDLPAFGPRVNDPVTLELASPRRLASEIEGQILYTDRFGNLITNLTPEALPERFVLTIARREITRCLRSYSEADGDESFLIKGSTGRLEISVNRESAAEVLGVGNGEKFWLRPA